MAVQDASNCQACGATSNLVHCEACKSRLSQGMAVGVCLQCRQDPRKMEAVGRIQASGSTNAAQLLCNLCIVHERQKQEDLLIQTVGGPTPTDLLRSIAASRSWFLVLSRATPEAKLSALGKLKRQIDFTTTERELANGLAAKDPMTALFMTGLNNAATAHETCTRAMEVYVNARVPTIKYKTLLLPPTGGMDRARRHFAECMASPDPLVAALAAERDFLCSWFEKQSTPIPKKVGKHTMPLEVPLHALITLRHVFKSLSQRIKKASARAESDLMLIRAWYSDHIMLANSMAQQSLADATAVTLRNQVVGPVRRELPPCRRR